MARSTAVPAQIMTVEDKIVGSLGMTQIILLGTALIGSGAIFLFVPPTSKVSLLKIALLIIMNAVLCGGAIRVKGELLLRWAIIGLTYVLRPRYWVYDKRSSALRPVEPKERKHAVQTLQDSPELVSYAPLPALDDAKRQQIAELMKNPNAKVRYINSRGGLKIVFTSETE